MEKSKLKTYDSDILAAPETTIYIKRFLRTKHGMVFKLNDKSV